MKDIKFYHVNGTFYTAGQLKMIFPETVSLTDEKVQDVLQSIEDKLQKERFVGGPEFCELDEWEVQEGNVLLAEITFECTGSYKTYDEDDEPIHMDGIPKINNQKDYMENLGDDVLFVLRDLFKDQAVVDSIAFLRSSEVRYEDWEEDYECPEPDMDEY